MSNTNGDLFKIGVPYSSSDKISVLLNDEQASFNIEQVDKTDEEGNITNTYEAVRVSNPLTQNDLLNVLITKESNTLSVLTSANINKPNTLFNKYQPKDATGKLLQNNRYLIHLNIDGEIIESSFRTKPNPMFATVKQIREDIGEFIPDYTDEYIESVIYQKSINVIDLIDTLKNQDDPIENVTYDTEVGTGTYITSDKAVKNWVRYATDIQLIYAKYFGISYNYGSIKKTIGDITVERNTKLPYIDQLLDWLKKAFDEADAIIRGINVVASFVKAKTKYSYEDWERTTNF
jgi:hypothetical protein